MSADPSSSAAGLSAAVQPQATPECPWLGLAHFAEADRDYFYGRDVEVRELTDRVRRAPLTVLYGVSGYGKSSILGAGLIPALRAAGHPIVLLRRCYDDLALRPLHADLITACVAAIPGSRPTDSPAASTLWEFFHDRSQPWFQRTGAEHDADSGADSPWPVLLLDQFEEIFIKGEDHATKDAAADARARDTARVFLTQLADLVENRPPAALRERLQSGLVDERRALVRRFDFQARPVRVALAVRDDFLGRLERWRRAMPSLMEHRVELRLLSGPQAFEAVFEPGTKRPGQPPIIPEEVAGAIVRAAAGAAPDVPLEEIDAVPPILSLLCERLNDRRLAISPPPVTIAVADFSPDEAKRILGRFYDDKLSHHPKALRDYLEDKLVSDSGFRENVTLDSALAALRGGIPDAEQRLRQLVDDRVLVIEDRGGIPRVELTHDTLARLALERRTGRQARARRRKAIAWSAASLTIAGVSLALSFWALHERARANDLLEMDNESRSEVYNEKQQALDLIRFIDSQVHDTFVDAAPLLLRERVSARLDAFYSSHLNDFDDRETLGFNLHKARVHLDAIKHYQSENISDRERKLLIGEARERVEDALGEVVHGLGYLKAIEMPDDRGVTRDRILAHYDFALLSRAVGDQSEAISHLQEAEAILDGISKDGGFSKVLWMDWMGLPNLDAAMGDVLAEKGDSSAATASYKKALEVETALAARPHAGKDQQKELKRLQGLAKTFAAATPKPDSKR